MTTLKHYHTDMIGTTRMMTDSTGTATGAATFTAFGQRISGSAQRYGYAGAYGYQTASSDDPLDAYAAGFKFLHVGARYYDPATGRFLQRDPIGIRGGLNVYAYVDDNPTVWIDPSGLGPKEWIKAIWEGIKARLSAVDPSEHMAGAARCMMDIALVNHIKKDHPDDPQPNPKCPACKRLTPKPPKNRPPPPPGKGPAPIG